MDFEQLVPQAGYVVGETACGHCGQLSRLQALIDVVADAGAQAVKFQVFGPEERVTKTHPEWSLFCDLTLSPDDWRAATAHARERGLAVLADVFGDYSLALASELSVDGFKIHSEDLLHSHFIARAAAAGKIVLVGVGGAHRIEVHQLLAFLAQRDLARRIVLMPGVQTFPTPLSAHSIDEVGNLLDRYGSDSVKVGFADHVSGDLEQASVLPLLGLARGACLVEKHVTVDRSQRWEDHESALGARDFARFVARVRELAPLLAPQGPLGEAEKRYRQNFKKCPVPVADLPAGHALTADDIRYARHADVKVPLASANLVGKRLRVAVEAQVPLRAQQLEGRVAGIIVARCSSSRLPNKALCPIAGRESIAHLIDRIKRCQRLDQVILATSTDASDDPLVAIAEREGIASFRGSLDNLAQRFHDAAVHYDVQHIVRITGDDIMRDEVMIDRAVAHHLEASTDVTFTDNMPYGMATEVFTRSALSVILEHARVPENTEYLEWYLENDRYFSVSRVAAGYRFDPRLRMTLDYEEDLAFFTRIIEHLAPHNPAFTLADTLAWLADHPEVIAINAHKTAKFQRTDLDVGLSI